MTEEMSEWMPEEMTEEMSEWMPEEMTDKNDRINDKIHARRDDR